MWCGTFEGVQFTPCVVCSCSMWFRMGMIQSSNLSIEIEKKGDLSTVSYLPPNPRGLHGFAIIAKQEHSLAVVAVGYQHVANAVEPMGAQLCAYRAQRGSRCAVSSKV